MSYKRLVTLLAGISVGLWLISCNPDPSCITPYVPYATTAFYSIDSNGDTTINKTAFDSIWADGNNLYRYLATNIDTTVFPLFVNPDTDSTIYHFCRNDTCSVITLYYTPHQFLISPECGADVKYKIDSIHGDFNSITLTNAELSRLLDVNIKIYR